MVSTADLLAAIQAEIQRRLDTSQMNGLEEWGAGTEKYRNITFEQLTAYEQRLLQRLGAEQGGFFLAAPADRPLGSS